MIDSNNQLKTLSKSLLNAVRGVMEAKSHTVPKTDKEKKLAALAEPHDKITHADVLKGRGVVREAEVPGVAAGSMEGEKHMCATKVFHKEWNQGTPLKTMHADPDTNGLIEWYDVMFEHGIERVMTEDMEVLQQESHMHSKKKMKEEVQEVAEKLSDQAKAAIRHAAGGIGAKVKPLVKLARMGKKPMDEEADQIDELSTDTMNNYARERSRTAFSGGRKPGESVDDGIKRKSRQINSMALSKTKINRVRDTGSTILNKEEVEVIDEALDAAARYGQHHVAIKELIKSISQHVESHKGDALKHRDYRGKKGVNGGHVGDVAQIHSMAESVEDYDVDQIDELSTSTLQNYRKKARAQGNAIIDKMKMGGGDWSKDQKDTKTLRKRSFGANASGKQLVKRGESLKTEDLELDEARGRPRKNPLPIADVEPEPRQHIIQQLQRAKLSMRGGEEVTFKNGKKGHVSGPAAAKILSRYAGMRPAEKEDFQKKIGASHEAFKQHL